MALVASCSKKSAIPCARKVLSANMVLETLLRRNSTCSENLKVELRTTPSTVIRSNLVMVGRDRRGNGEFRFFIMW